MKKSIVVLQSNYMPWKGYFDLINDADDFFFYDDVQYTKNDWRNRNQIKTSAGLKWITVPVGAQTNRLIRSVELHDDVWQRMHWKTLLHNYKRSAYFSNYEKFLEEFYLGHRWSSLSEMNQYLIKHIAQEFLGIKTEFKDSRIFKLTGQKQERLIDLVDKSKAFRYISGPSAKQYIDPIRFAEMGVELIWKDYTGYPPYPQKFPPFEHGASILDLLFSVGKDAPWYIWGWRKGPLHS